MADNMTLDEKVAAWVETSGRALELRIASAMSQSGWRVSTSFPYTDVHPPSVQREGDVLADLPWTGFNRARCLLRLVIECKNTHQKPWVAFYGQTPAAAQTPLDDLAVFAHGSHNGIVEPAHAWSGSPPFTNTPASHVATALGDDQHNPANNAVRQALSAALAIRQQYLETQSSAVTEGPRAWIVLGCVVTTSPLFQCHLKAGGKVELLQVDEADVWGYAPDGSRRRIYIRNEVSLPAFAVGLRQRVASLDSAE